MKTIFYILYFLCIVVQSVTLGLSGIKPTSWSYWVVMMSTVAAVILFWQGAISA